MSKERPVTSPYAHYLAEVRAWLERMIAALKFVELVAAILTLIAACATPTPSSPSSSPVFSSAS
jgi:hypothetical protein